MTNSFIKFCDKFGVHILFTCWLLFFFLHIHLYGIGTTLEAEKYIGEANNLLHHKGFSELRFLFYSITILVITLSIKLKIGFVGAVIIQSLYNLIATVFFYKALRLIFSKQIICLLIVITIIAFSPYSSWNVFLYTESIFYSNILLLTSAIIHHSQEKKKTTLFAILFLLLLTILSRPLGVLFVPGVLFYLYSIIPNRLKLILIPITIIGIIILVYITDIVFTTTGDATITLSAQQGCVVCGIIPTTKPTLNLLQNGHPLQELFFYITHNFSQCSKLGMERLNAFFLMTRSYYSRSHNIFILGFIIPIYGLSLISMVITKTKKYVPIFYFMLISIITFAVVVMLQCDDYHNRFILGLFPFFLILAAKTVEYLISKREA